VKEISMSLLDGILSQVSGNASVEGLASRVGLSPDQVEQAIAALGQAHASDGDTVQTAAEQTGLPEDKLQQILGHLGGEGALGQLASIMGSSDGSSSILGGLKNFL
jgi:hypothetical protein